MKPSVMPVKSFEKVALKPVAASQPQQSSAQDSAEFRRARMQWLRRNGHPDKNYKQLEQLAREDYRIMSAEERQAFMDEKRKEDAAISTMPSHS